ncbi:carboxypeptidase regulatory-like domain-containing protein [Gillisia hiemivivida]|uniref:TonB-dependent receptor n=1 Tax=Gillisia hiemivivida TaxID=291190 RepID=A0A5C6ZZR8_9FLAO|nr:carboxypeptidase regulatory-like domain-containing protein [Gillisia hiemivivida]TXD94903.1 TonB-dependent receptor [Gillisia hiemivivida]
MGRKAVIIPNNRGILIACFFLLAGNFLFGQHVVTGTLSDSKNNTVSNANVLLYKNKKLIKFTFSNIKGVFRLDSLGAAKNYEVRISSMTFKDTTVQFELNKSIQLDLELREKVEPIKEVVINVERAIQIRGDTIIFKADAFRNRQNVVVEELLKNIPGIEIAENGRIRFQGKLVTNVKIDDDDLLEGGYPVLTKNLNADLIDKVEVLQNYSRNPLLKNVRDTEDVALNLTLKAERKAVLFGNMDAGYSLKKHHDISANGISFLNKSKHYLFLNYNNVGKDLVLNINDIFKIINDDESYSLGNTARTRSYVHLNTTRPILNERLVNFNNTKFNNLNSIFNISKNIKIKTTGILFSDDKDYLSNNSTTFLTDDPFQIYEDFKTRNEDKLGFFRANLQWNFNKKERLEYIGSHYNFKNIGLSNLTQNNTAIQENLSGKVKRNNHFLHYTFKLKDSSAFVASARYLNDSRSQFYKVSPYLYGDFFSFEAPVDSIDNSITSIKNKVTFKGVQLGYIRNGKDSNWESYLGSSSRTDNFNSFLKFSSEEADLGQDLKFVNHLNYHSTLYYLKNRFRKTFASFKLFANFDMNYEKLRTNKRNGSELNYFFYIQAGVNLKYNLYKKHELLTGLQFNQNTTRAENNLENNLQNSYRSFYRNLGRNDVLDNYKGYVDYRYGNWTDIFTANLNFTYQYNNNYLSNASVISPQLNQVEQILLNGSDKLTFGANADRYLNFLSSNLKLKISYEETGYEDVLNGINRLINSSQLTYGFELRSVFPGFLNIITGIQWNQISFDLNEYSGNNLNNKSFVDINLDFSENFKVFIENERYYFGNLSDNKKSYYFTALDGRYYFMDNKLSFFVKVNNLFNTENFNIFSLTDTTEFDSSTKLIPRYTMFGVSYRF